MKDFFSNLEPFQIMLYLFIATALLHYYNLRLEDNECKPVLRRILSIVCVILGFLSAPVTVAVILISLLYADRNVKAHDREITRVKAEMITSHVSEVQSLKNRIAEYDTLIESVRKRSYNAGYQAGLCEARKEYEKG